MGGVIVKPESSHLIECRPTSPIKQSSVVRIADQVRRQHSQNQQEGAISALGYIEIDQTEHLNGALPKMSDNQPPVPAGQVSPDGQFVRSGTNWVPNPNLPKAKKSHTVRNVLLGITFAFILLFGGCLALIGGTANEIDKSITKHENKEGGSKNPINISEGKGFKIGDNEYLPGWSFENNALGDADVAGLKVTNNSDEADYPDIEFRFFNGKEELAEVSCGLLKEVQPGTTAKIECSGDQPLPKKWDNLTVQNSI